jgi:hypothetical protein
MPQEGDRVGGVIVVQGRAAVGTSVVVRAEVPAAGPLPALSLGPVTVAVSPAGTWEVRIVLPAAAARPGRSIAVTAVAAQGGAQSDAARVTVEVGPRELERP